MQWRKLGLVYCPDGTRPWARTHALAPTPILRADGGLRVYFSTITNDNIGSISYVDLDPSNPTRVVHVADHPVLGPGEDGCFDDNGVNVTSLIAASDGLRLYYFGYQLHQRVRYTLFAGMALSIDGGETFQRVQQTPILERRDGERFVRSAPFVTPRSSGGFDMIYVSGDSFVSVGGKMLPKYELRSLSSPDGLTWVGGGMTSLELDGDDEFGFGRPYVYMGNGGPELFFSVRSRSRGYRIGHAKWDQATSSWRRDAETANIDVAAQGWDSEMVCYAAVTAVGDRTYMFYNGNGYGRTGFGVCIREEG
jgi:hypothetical protein